MKLINNIKYGRDMIKAIIVIFSSFFTSHAYSLSCGSGCGGTLETMINKNVSRNETGYTTDSPSITVSNLDINIDRWGVVQQWTSYIGGEIPPSQYQQNDFVFQKVDDYISIALSWERCGKTWFVPVNIPMYGDGCGNSRIIEYRPGDVINTIPKTYKTRLRIDRPIVSGSFSRRIPIAETGVCQGRGCRTKELVTKIIYVSIDLIVPQKCTLNAGKIISMDFGTINSSKFTKAGERPEGVLPKSKIINIQCDNIGGNANLTLRIEANAASGNAIISDNKDVGFVVTDEKNKALMPNTLSSIIPFSLDGNANANVTIKAYPVSVTGNKPSEGVVTSLAYLRVDFD